MPAQSPSSWSTVTLSYDRDGLDQTSIKLPLSLTAERIIFADDKTASRTTLFLSHRANQLKPEARSGPSKKTTLGGGEDEPLLLGVLRHIGGVSFYGDV